VPAKTETKDKKPDIIISVSYVCPVCNKSYSKSPEEALKCRNSHIEPNAIIDVGYKEECKIPHKILVQFEDGFVCWYYLSNEFDAYHDHYEHLKITGGSNK